MMARGLCFSEKPKLTGEADRATRGGQGQMEWGGQAGEGERKRVSENGQGLSSLISLEGWRGQRLGSTAWLHSHLVSQVHTSGRWPDQPRCTSLPLFLRTNLAQ